MFRANRVPSSSLATNRRSGFCERSTKNSISQTEIQHLNKQPYIISSIFNYRVRPGAGVEIHVRLRLIEELGIRY